MTFTANAWTLDYVDLKGFIRWERKARYQMVGKRRKFIRDPWPLNKGSNGYAYETGERIKGCRIARPKHRATPDQGAA